MARGEVAGLLVIWEVVSVEADGWRIWRPAVVLKTVENAGPSAELAAVEGVNWPDSCLGLAKQGQTCLQVITPGYRVSVTSGGGTLMYRVSTRGLIESEP